MPLIAIARGQRLDDYLESIRRAGGQPLEVTDDGEPPERLLAQVDGLLLSGGGDVDPAIYGEAPHPTFEAAEPGRDRFEMALVRAALAGGTPLLAVCRGLQVLNVALGGSLIQDIPSQVPGATAHSVTTARDLVAHRALVARASRLHGLLGPAVEPGDWCPVNSRHHQSVARLASGLEVTATASDGVIEAVERPGAPFCVGVQWHPENFWRSGRFDGLFAGFVQAASARRP